jgi:ketosteroid isomerase-like protein
MASTQIGQDNVALVRRGFEAFGTGDIATLTELFHPDATWHAPAVGVLGGDRIGRDAIFAMFGMLGQETNGTFRAIPSTFAAAGDDQVFVRVYATGTRNDKSLESDEMLVFTLAEGKLRDVRFFMFDYPGNVAFWS